MRREFPARVKVAAYERAKGSCEGCGARLTVGKFAYDHINPDGLTGEPTLENCKVLCTPCHSTKTVRDVADIARAKRRQARHLGVRKPRTIRAWRKFDGTIVRKD